jgi:hypothetical protein
MVRVQTTLCPSTYGYPVHPFAEASEALKRYRIEMQAVEVRMMPQNEV